MGTLNFALIGYGLIGQAYSHALHDVAAFFPDLPLRPAKKVLCGRNVEALEQVARRWGWEAWSPDWPEVMGRRDVHAVIIGLPNRFHRDVCLAALSAGKHVLCEKPLAMNLQEAEEMAVAARKAGVCHGVAFNYRRVPAVALARRLTNEGHIGRVYHFRATYLQDWLVDPEYPLTWRLRREEAGSGTLGDLLSHSVDLARFLVGDIAELVANATTFIEERSLAPSGESSNRAKGRVTVDDAASLLVRFADGAVGSFEASRFATGRKSANTLEVYGEKGSLAFNLERMNELEFYSARDPSEARGFRRILVTEPDHPYMNSWWPPGHIIGWEHTFIHQIKDFIEAIAEQKPFAPDFDAGLACQRVLDAAERSLAGRRWVKVSEEGAIG